MHTSTDAPVRELIPRSSLGEGAVESVSADTTEAQIIRIRRGLRVREFVDPTVRLGFDALERRTTEIYQQYQKELDAEHEARKNRIDKLYRKVLGGLQ